LSSEYEQARNIAYNHRTKLIGKFKFLFNQLGYTDSGCAFELTQHAIKRGFIPERKPLDGSALDRMEHGTTKLPIWASKAMAELLLNNDYTPKSEAEYASLGWLWLEAKGPFSSLEDALNSFPIGLDREMIKKYVTLFYEDG